MLSPDGACKSFDASGNGYVRSEAVVAIYIQRAPQAKRIYATLVHSKTNTDGSKSQGNRHRVIGRERLEKGKERDRWRKGRGIIDSKSKIKK